MYCTSCNCEYEGWTGKCPKCKEPLQELKPYDAELAMERMDYDSLVELLDKAGSGLEINLTACQVVRKKSKRFPWRSFGYAWTQKMRGSADGISVEMQTTEVSKDREITFLYRGHGYAWEQEVQGQINGNPFTIQATEVKRKRTFSFPYSGFGYAWTEEMRGKCGDQIQVVVRATKVNKKRRSVFPYFGYGFAWVEEGLLSLKLMPKEAFSPHVDKLRIAA